MTPVEAQQLAAELARECLVKMVDQSEDVADSERYVCEAILNALRRVLTPTRIQAAERAVVEAAVAWREAETAKRKQPLTVADAKDLDQLLAIELEAVDRLRALRELQALEECGDLAWAVTRPDEPVGVGIPRRKHTIRCTEPRGHDGPHRGDLGEWTWEDGT